MKAEKFENKEDKLSNPSNEIDDNIDYNLKYLKSFKNNFGKKRKNLTHEEAIKKFNDLNLDYLGQNKESNKEIIRILMNNTKITPIENQAIYWKEIIQIINSIKKLDKEYPYPKLPYGKSLSDEEFIDLLKSVVLYIGYSFKEEKLNEIKKELGNLEDYTENIFKYEQILKDIKENGLLTYLISEEKNDKKDSLQLLKVDLCSFTPITELKFKKNNVNYNLNKKEFKERLTSKILLNAYKETLINFIPNFNKIIKTDNDLIQFIVNYIDKYNIYFCRFSKDLYAITIHTGNIYLKSKYIREYYNNFDEEDLIIVREKMTLNVQHEINHVLVREIDNDKKDNFFLKSEHKNKSDDEMLLFKDRFVSNYNYTLPKNESGNYFDHIFYNKYYFDNLLIEEANFFLNIKNIKNSKEYEDELQKIINEEKDHAFNTGSINKFKKSHFNYARCFKSSILGITYNKED